MKTQFWRMWRIASKKSPTAEVLPRRLWRLLMTTSGGWGRQKRIPIIKHRFVILSKQNPRKGRCVLLKLCIILKLTLFERLSSRISWDIAPFPRDRIILDQHCAEMGITSCICLSISVVALDPCLIYDTDRCGWIGGPLCACAPVRLHCRLALDPCLIYDTDRYGWIWGSLCACAPARRHCRRFQPNCNRLLPAIIVA